MQFVDALVCVSPGHVLLEQRPTPSRGLGHALVRPRRIGICGTDYHIFEGKHPFLQYPRVMGHELAVEIVEAPPEAGFKPGEICVVNPYISCGECVACMRGKANCCTKISVLGVHQDGGMQQIISIPASNLLRANDLTADECATVEFLAIGAHAVRRGAISHQDKVLVVGAGPIGLGVALFARISGATVTVLDLDPERAKAAEVIAGVKSIIPNENVQQSIAALTGDTGFDVVCDATGNRTSMEKGFDFVSHGGRYVLVSVVKDPITFSDPDFHRKEITLLGSRNATSADFDTVISAIRERQLPIDKLITHRTSLAAAADKLPVWAKRKAGLIKAMIEID